ACLNPELRAVDSPRFPVRMPYELTASSILEAVPFAIVVLDGSGRIARVNAACERMFGLPRDILIGAPLSAHVVLHGEPAELTGSREASHEATGHLGNGVTIPLEATIRPLRADGPVLLTLVDLTPRRQAELRFRTAVEASPHGMIMVDPAGTIVLVNEETLRIFGYSREELLGRSVEMLVPAAFRGSHPGQRAAFLREPSKRLMGAGRDLFGRHRDGSEKQVEIGLSPIETAEGVYVLASVVDIQTRKETEDALRRSNEELE